MRTGLDWASAFTTSSSMLTRFARDLSHLMAMLDRLDGFALSEHRSVTVPLLKKMLAEQDVA